MRKTMRETISGWDTVKIHLGGKILEMEGVWNAVPYEHNSFYAGLTGKRMVLVGPATVGAPPSNREPECWMGEETPDSEPIEVPAGERVFVRCLNAPGEDEKARMRVGSVTQEDLLSELNEKEFKKALSSRLDAPSMIRALDRAWCPIWQDPFEPPWVVYISGANGNIKILPLEKSGGRFPRWQAQTPDWMPRDVKWNPTDVDAVYLALTEKLP